MTTKKMNIKKDKIKMFVDTETILTLENAIPFDLSVKIVNTDTMETLEEKSFIVRRFINNKFIMLSSFSANKYPLYKDYIKNDKRFNVVSVKDLQTRLSKLVKKYKIKTIVAHNGTFDVNAIERLFTMFDLKNPLQKLRLLDTIELSKTITQSQDYENFCKQWQYCKMLDGNGNKVSKFLSPSGRVRYSAQAIYCYLTKNVKFEESHTGLDDIEIEMLIYKESAKLNKNKLVRINHSPSWQEFKVVA